MDAASLERLNNPETIRSLKTLDQAAATTVWAAVGKEWEGRGGKYLEDMGLAQPVQEPPLPMSGHADWIYDGEAAKRLWTETLRLIGMADDQ